MSGFDLKDFDLKEYADLYTGRTKIHRLIFISEVSHDLRETALQIAYEEVKKGCDVDLFETVVVARKGHLDEVDKEWIEEVKAGNEVKEAELKQIIDAQGDTYLNRMDYGDFLLSKGNLRHVWSNYATARKHASSDEEALDLHLKKFVLRVECDKIHMLSLSFNEEDVEMGKRKQMSPLHQDKLFSAKGLVKFKHRNYKGAAMAFVRVSRRMGSKYDDVIATEDVGVYGALCSLASFDRTQLKEDVIDNETFDLLDYEVPEMKELIIWFHSSNFDCCFDSLEIMKPKLRLDMYLGEHGHLEELLGRITDNVLVLYTSAFKAVDLRQMIRRLHLRNSLEDIEDRLVRLIINNKIEGRIDSIKKVLEKREYMAGPSQ